MIVGGGVTGLSAGWWLARSGVSVTVLDKGIVGWEASGRNGGGASHYQSPLFDEEQRLWPQMDELLGYPTEHQKDRIIIAMSERQWEQYQFVADRHHRLGHPVDVLDVKQVQDAVPLAGDTCFGGVHYKFGGHANPQRTVQAYAWALQDLGGKNLPLAPARAEMIITEPAPMMPIGGVDGHKLYGRQTLRGNLAYGGGPHEWMEVDATGPAARPSTPLMRNLASRLAELLPKAAHLNIIRSWAGIIENSPDGRPIIDRLTSPDNVTVASMSGVGFGLSPASGHAIRDLVIDGTCSFADIDSLKLSRFDSLEADWREKRGWMPIS